MAADHAPKRTVRIHPQQMVNCPRCQSPDTKFCYYNNYSTSQPRYFCKNCKRYWTDGGTLRNVPVGGGLRKNKRSKTRVPTSSTSSDNTAPTSVGAFLSSLAASSTSSHQILPSSLSSALTHENQLINPGFLNTLSANDPGGVTNLAISPYVVYNPGMFEPGDQPIPHPLGYGEVNFINYIPPLSPLSILGTGLKQNITSKETLGASPLLYSNRSLRDQERPLSEISLQHAVLHNNSKDGTVNYTNNGHVNINDWQQISESLFGGGGESNLFFMQSSQQTHQQWSEFNPATRL